MRAEIQENYNHKSRFNVNKLMELEKMADYHINRGEIGDGFNLLRRSKHTRGNNAKVLMYTGSYTARSRLSSGKFLMKLLSNKTRKGFCR